MKLNDESKVRRSTKSEILAKGEGKVMSYEDLLKARAVRAQKEAAREAKGKGETWSKAEECCARGRGSFVDNARPWPEAQEC
jgi:hypothetical protein